MTEKWVEYNIPIILKWKSRQKYKTEVYLAEAEGIQL